LATGTTDYTPYIQGIMESDPDIVLVSTQFADSVALTGGLNAAGYKGLILSYIAYVPGLLDAQPAIAAALEGSYAMTQFPPQEGGGPVIDQVLADLKASGLTEFVSTGTAVGWWSADFYLQALEAAGGDPAKVPDLLKAGFTYQGFDPQADAVWPDLIDVALPCQAMMKVEDAKYVVAQPYACYKNVTVG
jgi:ABC-type branched-subunit amino acid transport system substrate-binding protein